MSDWFYVLCAFNTVLFLIVAPLTARRFLRGPERQLPALCLPLLCSAGFTFSLPLGRVQAWVPLLAGFYFATVIVVTIRFTLGRLLDRLETPQERLPGVTA